MPLDLSLSDMPWLGQPAQVNGGDIVNGILKGATGVMSLAKMKREREMEEVRFAQAQHEFKQKDEAFDQNKRSAALQMQGQEYQNVVLRNKATQTALQTAWETDNEEAMTKFQVLSYQMITGNKYDDPVLQDELSNTLSSSPRLLQNPQMQSLFEMMRDGRQVYETNQAKKTEREAKAKELPADVQSVQYTAQQRAIAADPNADPAKRAKAQLFVDEDDKRRVRSGETITTFGPDGKPIATIERGGSGGKAAADPGALTPTNTTKAQQDFQSGQRLLAASEKLIPLISSETFGPQAFFNSIVKDKLLGNVFPFLVSEKRQDAAVIAGDIRSATIQSMKSDSNIAQPEVSKLEEMFPAPSQLLDSPERARLLTKSVAKLAASRVLLSGKKLGLYSKSKDQFDRDVLPQKIDRAVVKALAYDDIKALYDSGLIDSEILVALRNASDPEMGYGITKKQAAAIYYGR
jgi:hypothetical protein